MTTLEHTLLGDHAIMQFQSTPYPSQHTRVVPGFKNNFRLGAQARGINLTVLTIGRA
jgi:hypothetical protein